MGIDMRRAASAAKQKARRLLLARGFEVTRVTTGEDGAPAYSDVEQRVDRLLQKLSPSDRHCVDIGAADGKQGSNSYALFRAGWAGLAVEPDEGMFGRLALNHAGTPQVQLYRGFVTPHNVVPLLEAAGIPKTFGFLSLDVDGYDYDILVAVLATFRPALMCVEYNEKVPPPIRFRVRYSPDFTFREGICYGMSLATVHDLCAAHDLALLDVWYNNALLAPAERGLVGMGRDAAYQRGYVDRPDRLEKMPWNRQYESLRTMTPAGAIDVINRQPDCAGRRHHYEISEGE
jgi:hypothetical protein